MALENIIGNLLNYKELGLGTFQHVDEITIERRTKDGLRHQQLYTADGALYTVQKGKPLWAITRRPQNLVLQNIDKTSWQLINGNYFLDAEAAKKSLEHEDSVVIDLEELRLVIEDYRYGRFEVDPKAVHKLNSEQRRAAQRIYGPDEENFGLNMEMFVEAGITPCVFVLMPGYVRNTLRTNRTEFICRASFLDSFERESIFWAGDLGGDSCCVVYGVR